MMFSNAIEIEMTVVLIVTVGKICVFQQKNFALQRN